MFSINKPLFLVTKNWGFSHREFVVLGHAQWGQSQSKVVFFILFYNKDKAPIAHSAESPLGNTNLIMFCFEY